MVYIYHILFFWLIHQRTQVVSISRQLYIMLKWTWECRELSKILIRQTHKTVDANINWCRHWWKTIWHFLKKKKNRNTMWSNSLTPSYISEGCVANILDHIMTCHSFSFKDFLKLSFWRECQINSMFIDRIFQKTVLKSNICCFHHVIFSRLNIFCECLTRSSSKLL